MTDIIELMAQAMCDDEDGPGSWDRHGGYDHWRWRAKSAIAALSEAGYEIRRIRSVHRPKP